MRATMMSLVIEHFYSNLLKFTKNIRLEIEVEVRIGISLGI